MPFTAAQTTAFFALADNLPSIDQGWGRVELDTILDFNDEAEDELQPDRESSQHRLDSACLPSFASHNPTKSPRP